MYVQERVSLDENKTISVGLGVRPVPYRLNSVSHHSTTTVLKADLQGLATIQPACQHSGASGQRGNLFPSVLPIGCAKRGTQPFGRRRSSSGVEVDCWGAVSTDVGEPRDIDPHREHSAKGM